MNFFALISSPKGKEFSRSIDKTIAWDEWDAFTKEMQFDDEMWMFILDSDNNYMNLMQGFVITRNKVPACVFNITAED